MSQFQGSGFVIDLPEKCWDASSYTFVLPEEGGFSPNLTIRFELVPEGYELEKSVLDELKALSLSLDDFVMVSQNSGKRGGNDGIICVYEWGQEPARLRQRVITLLVGGDVLRKYILTTTVLAASCDKSEAVFDRMLGSLEFNGVQVV
ncbi:DUF1795 domain-containing protein [Vibrio sp. JC009]|uniref:DcrB-related protein n=1 Tax=Vibrio sp. JC009 TaxID=2912314 RepID=UPI0023B15A05|nr:DcrB-related protein [Vibrio sp. JC009]WED22955.1 DUF1795 domain-containing protein [Vibrio sp. JC009]